MSELSAPELAAPSQPEPRGSEQPGKILVCDDSAAVRGFIRALLEPEYLCQVVASGEEALAVAPSFGPDVVISDLLMDGMTGYDLCRKFRETPELASIPFILLTSKTGDEERAKGLEVGADDYLYKPIRQRELKARVLSLLRLRRANLTLEFRSRELEKANQVLRDTQAALLHAEKLATVGTLAAGVAHEVNNPLAFMKSGLSTMMSLFGDLGTALRPLSAGRGAEEVAEVADLLGELREIGTEVQEGTRRIERIVKDLRDFASDRREGTEEVALAAEVERAWKLASMRSVSRPQLETELEQNVSISTVRHQIGQVLLNIFINAIQAMDGLGGGGGRVKVTARRESELAVIEITDSGPGIPPEHLPRIFDPFFSTKPLGQGTGLGLSVSYGIIRGMGGTIEASSVPGRGATFTVRVPLVQSRRLATVEGGFPPSARAG